MSGRLRGPKPSLLRAPVRVPSSRRGTRRLAVCAAMALAAGAPAAATPEGANDPRVERLAEAVRYRTISREDPADFDPAPFRAFHRFLQGAFPRTHAALEREVVNDYSLLYTWRGSDSSLEPLLLTAHQDVVPVPDDALARWTQPPFAGVIDGGFVWGRGTLDDKVGVLGILEAVESLLGAGFVPTRTVYLAFGHDEELGGTAGAAAITERLAARGVRLWFSLDEGMAIVEGLAGLQQPVAMVGVAEKGSLTVEVTAHAPGGHSSLPPRQSAIGKLARAIVRIESKPQPPHLDGVAGEMLDGLAPFLPGGQRFAVRNRWLLSPLLVRALSGSPVTDAILRTTTAVTIVRGGVKLNVLPSSATATVNFRIHPGDRTEDVLERLRTTLEDYDVTIEVVGRTEASPVSRSDSPAFETLREAIASTYPDTPVVPALVLGGTDSRHYGRIAGDAYRFSPLRLTPEDARRLHGIDERIAIGTYLAVPPFYEAVLRRAAR